MKTTTSSGSVAPIFLSMLLAGTRLLLAEAGKDRLGVTHDDIDFLVDRHDDGRDEPYAVTFTDSGFKSIYTFDEYGSVVDIEVDGETYEVLYKNNGDLKKVKHTSSDDRRNLAEEEIEGDAAGAAATAAADGDTLEEEEDEEKGPTPAGSRSRHRRRLYDCRDCEHTWETVCDEGLETICILDGYGTPLSPSALVSIDLFCESFGGACSELSASDVCDGECEECLPPMTITLEWSGGRGSSTDPSLAYALDLYVIEPGGTTVFWDNKESASATLHTEAYKRTYTVSEGLYPTFPPNTTFGATSGSIPGSTFGPTGPISSISTEPTGPTSSGTPSSTMSGGTGSSPSMSGPESGGMEPVDATGAYVAFAEWWQGEAPIYWTMTATAGSGEVMALVEGQFIGDCASSSTSQGSTTYDQEYGHGVSKLVYMTLSEYVDNECDAFGSPSP